MKLERWIYHERKHLSRKIKGHRRELKPSVHYGTVLYVCSYVLCQLELRTGVHYPPVVFLLRNSFSRSFLYNRGGFIRGRKRGEGGEEAALINADAFLLVAE